MLAPNPPFQLNNRNMAHGGLQRVSFLHHYEPIEYCRLASLRGKAMILVFHW